VLALDRWLLEETTRSEALKWINSNVATGAAIVNFDAYLPINENKETEADMKQYATVFTAKRAFLLGMDPLLYPSPNYYVLTVAHYGTIPAPVIDRDYQYALLSIWDKEERREKLEQLKTMIGAKQIELIKRFPDDATPFQRALDIVNDAEEPLPYLYGGGQNGPMIEIYKITE
jgi:hypothetical protein